MTARGITGILPAEVEAMMTTVAPGVLPDNVSRDPRAESWLVFIDFADGADVQSWLRDVATPAVQTLTAPTPELKAPVAVCTIGFGFSIFDKAKVPDLRPPGLNAVVPEVPPDNHDLVFYIFSTSDAAVADFLRQVVSGPEVANVVIERGYQRANRREVFGQLDGLRNVVPRSDRSKVAFVGDDDPEVPTWAVGGSYMTYIKIKQDVAAWGKLTTEQREQIIGRHLDGSRLDLDIQTPVESEGQIAQGAASPPLSSHVRKAGPRGSANEDCVRILRRGTPFIECSGPALIEGLQFVSYQASMDDFLTIFQRWMLNPSFPSNGAGRDALFADQNPFASFMKGGVYFAAPADERYIGAGLFDPAIADTGVLQIRLTVVGPDNKPDPTASLEGAVFNITDAQGTQRESVTTNAAGHATASHLPVDVDLTVSEVQAPRNANLPSPATQTIKVERCRPGLVRFINVHSGPPGRYV